MRRLAALSLEMLRYRVAVMLWMFMLLGAAYHGITRLPPVDLLALSIALAASYVAATTVNDIADAEIDKVNHPRGRGRPLVAGTATPRDLWVLNAVAAAVALGAGAVVGPRGLLVVAVSLVIGYVYSLEPFLLSYRPYTATPVLAVAYVLAPYAHGLALADVLPGRRDALFAGALFALFMARIVLKDFRDLPGDRMFGRRTFLIRHGKPATCLVSVLALAVGTTLLLLALPLSPLLDAVVLLYVAAVAFQLHRLSRTSDPHREQVAIGLAARMGNGLLVTVLAWLLLDAQGAGPQESALLAALLLAVYGGSFLLLARRPDQVLIGYKG